MSLTLFLSTWGIFTSVVVLLACAVFVLAQILKDNSVMDIAYGPLFALAGFSTWWLTGAPKNVPVIIILAAVTLWALRLCMRIFRKNWKKPEDTRYAAWRTAWSSKGQWYFILRSFLQINLLQGLIIAIVGLPVVAILAHPNEAVSPIFVIGTSLFIVGLLYESLADWQLDRFLTAKRNGTETATLMKQGLFRYSRRPNYFGESLLWWGLALAVAATPYGLIALSSPLTITYIVTRVTGPMLEKQFLDRYPSEYQEYMTETNYFVPGKPRVSQA